MRPIGEIQLGVLDALDEHGGWEPGCGWVWTTHAQTQKVLDTLVRRGLAKVSNIDGRPGTRRYRITAEGREILGASNGS